MVINRLSIELIVISHLPDRALHLCTEPIVMSRPFTCRADPDGVLAGGGPPVARLPAGGPAAGGGGGAHDEASAAGVAVPLAGRAGAPGTLLQGPPPEPLRRFWLG